MLKRLTTPKGSCGVARSCGLEAWTESKHRYGSGREVGELMGVRTFTWERSACAFNCLSSLPDPQNVFFWKILLMADLSEPLKWLREESLICPQLLFPSLCLPLSSQNATPCLLICSVKVPFPWRCKCWLTERSSLSLFSLLLSKLSRSLIPCRWM